MVGSRGVPARGGGAERVVECLAGALTRRGHEIIVYGRPDYLRGAPPWPDGHVVLTGGLRGKNFETFTHTATAVWDLMRRDVDIVHVHSPGPALWSWVPALGGGAVVLTIHAADWRRDKWSLPAKLMLNMGLKIGMRIAREVTAVAEPLAAELAERFGRDVTFVPNSVEQVRPEPPGQLLNDPRWSLSPDNYVLYVGRIEPEKRLDILLKAWEKAAQGVNGFKLAVAGDLHGTPYGRQCRRIAPRNVVFLGLQHDRNLAELYSNAAMVIQPSVLEGMSLVLLEAAAYERCVLCTKLQENVRIFGDNGVYFDSDDTNGLAALICRYLNSRRERRLAGRGAHETVARKPSWTEVATEMEHVYERALG